MLRYGYHKVIKGGSKMKVNVNKKTAIQDISDTLNHCQMLLQFEVESLPHKTLLQIQTESKEVEYTTINNGAMISFLEKLKNHAHEHIEDINELIAELI